MIDLVCIGCPKGCHLHVDETNDYEVTGYGCNIGKEYGRNELLNPTRVLTTTVKINNGIHNRLPVRSNNPLPKEKLLEASLSLNNIVVTSPIKKGDIIVKNILNTGVDIISSRDM